MCRIYYARYKYTVGLRKTFTLQLLIYYIYRIDNNVLSNYLKVS